MRYQSIWDDEYWMHSNGFYCGFNMPPGLKSKDGVNGVEVGHSLPPYNKRRTFLADEFPACPSNWMLSEGKLTSYFVPVAEDSGMWLDFNKNWDHTHDVAIVVSIQGINPITGLPCNDPHLEQYIEKCPKCDKKFGPNRFCKDCGYSWAKQNYICTTGTPSKQLWLDGFRAADGIVRQYILTQEKLKGVANAIVGEDRVFAVGISFFISKEKKKVVEESPRGFYAPTYTPVNWNIASGTTVSYSSASTTFSNSSAHVFSRKGSVPDMDKCLKSTRRLTKSGTKGGGASAGGTNDVYYAQCASPAAASSAPDLVMGDFDHDSVEGTLGFINDEVGFGHRLGSSDAVSVKKLEVGAGARISQVIHDDPENLDYWRNEPEAIICINYCSEKETKAIYEKGRVKLTSHKEGFLKEIPVGNV